MAIFAVAPTGKAAPDVFVVSGKMVNYYLVRGPEGIVAVDTGPSKPDTGDQLGILGIDPSEVVAIFLTHSDFDHTGGLGLFPQARLYLGQGEEPLVTGKVRRIFGRFNRPLDRLYSLLTDGQTVTEAGLSIQAISTPGHTPGSISYRVNEKWLFTGDTVRLVKGRVVPFIGFINMNTRIQKQSIRKLARLDGIELLGTAHHGISYDFTQAMQAWRPKGYTKALPNEVQKDD
jgi:hydroxyacylglutathione hydrolase